MDDDHSRNATLQEAISNHTHEFGETFTPYILFYQRCESLQRSPAIRINARKFAKTKAAASVNKKKRSRKVEDGRKDRRDMDYKLALAESAIGKNRAAKAGKELKKPKPRMPDDDVNGEEEDEGDEEDEEMDEDDDL